MFGLFKKKDKNNKATKNTKAEHKQQVSKYNPVLSTPDDFMRVYRQGEEHIVIGRNQGSNVGVTAIDPPADSLLVINDNSDEILRQCVIPTVEQSKLSYIIYDPNGAYYNALADKMKARLYDIQVLDLESSMNKSTVDLFEVVNITKNTYWTSVILAGSIKCEGAEIQAAHNLFMTMMEYLLEKKGCIFIEDMQELFNKVSVNDKETLLDMEKCSSAKPSLLRLINADPKDRGSVYKKAAVYFFRDISKKIKNPNIFTVTSHKRKTVTFIKKVPAQYRNLISAMLFNLKVSSILCGDGSASTLIIDTSNEEWYNRKLLENLTREAGDSMDKSVAMMKIRDSFNESDLSNNGILIYMHSEDYNTRNHVFELLKTKNQLSQEEQVALSTQLYGGKPVPEETLEASPVQIGELSILRDEIVIDLTKNTKAFRCSRLA